MKNDRRGARALRASLLAGVIYAAFLTTGHAQSVPSAGEDPADASSAPPATPSAAATASENVAEEIVVTGSRVISNGNASPTPVTVVPTEVLLELKPGPVAEALSTLPVFSGSRVGVSNPGTGVTNAGANELNLRNLGFYRTLVLFDGHRVPPSTYDQVVDVDMIPQMLLQRVDVVTGGASAVYGSDAVSGVVNYVTDTKFNGLKLDVEGGLSTHGDDRTVNSGIAAGRPLADGRGHVEFSYQYRDDPGILRRSDREWGRDVWTVQGGGTVANPYHLVENTRIVATTFGGLISGATGAGAGLNGQTFAQNGVLSPFVHGAPTGNAGYESGGSGGYYDGSLKAALTSHQLFGRFDFDVSDNLHAYLEASDTINRGLNFGQYDQINTVTMNGQNPFLPAPSQFAGTFRLSKLFTDIPRIDTNTAQNQYFINGGLQGRLGDGYKWDLSGTHSEARTRTRNDANINNQSLAAALDAAANPANGQVVCRASLTNSAYSNCVPLNVFGPTAESSAAIAYITQPTRFTVVTKMDDATASISGAPINLWAGPVKTALSGELRRLTYSVSSTAQPSQKADCTSLTSNCTASTLLWADATLANTGPVSQTVAEGAFEADAPLLKDLPWAEDVSLNGAVRFAHYDTSGSAWTWKGGLVWQATDELRLRGTRSRDFRAPTLYDLFQPQAVATNAFTDTLTGNTYPALVHTGGNPNLRPEVGNTTSAGLVYQPAWLPRFSLSVDAYNIDVSNALLSTAGYSPVIQSVCYASGGSSPYCSLQQRALNSFTNTSPANVVTDWYASTINISHVKTYGADFELNYAATLFNNPLTLRGLVTWQPHIVYVTPGLVTVDQGGSGLNANNLFPAPQVRTTLMASYKIANFSLGLMERIRSGLTWTNDPTQYVSTPPLGWYALTDINLSYRVDSSLGAAEIFLNVQNLLDKQPPPLAGTQANANVGTFGGFAIGDDPIGRYFTLGVRFRR
jgi:iron complex outermembrane receptor protein